MGGRVDSKGQDELKAKFGVQSWDQVDDSRGRSLVEQVQNGSISKEQWDFLKENVPNFLDVVSNGLIAIGQVSGAVVAAQTEALKAINEGIAAARDIANGSDDPDVKKRAFEAIEKGFEKAEAMNSGNNITWKAIVGGVVAVVSIAGGLLALAR